MSKKVLYISPNGYLGGAERFVLNACIGHKTVGDFEPEILFLNTGEFVEIAKRHGIKVHTLKSKFKLSNPIQLFKATREISKLLKTINPDVINSTMPYSHLVLSFCAKSDRIVNIWFQHGPVGGTLDKLAGLTRCDHIFFNTDYLKNEHYRTAKQLGLRFGDSILHYGIDTKVVSRDVSRQIKKQYVSDENKLLIIAAGRICGWKGYDSIIKAFSEIYTENKELLKGHRFILVGEVKRESDKPYYDSLLELGKELIADGFLEFIPFQENLNEYFRASDVFIHSSTIPEPFGLVVAEAMTQDTLVIGGSDGGVTEVLRNGETGFSFDAHTDEAVPQLKKILLGILKEYENNEHHIKMRKAAMDLILDSFSVPKMTKTLESRYSNMIKGKTNG